MRRLLLLVAVLCLASLAAAQDGLKHYLTDMPSPAPGIQTQTWFPDYPETSFPAGKVVEVDVGFYNGGSAPVNVTGVAGSLNSKENFQYYQNFTFQPSQGVVRPGEEASIMYKFQPSEQLPPREFQVALTVFYSTAAALHATTFFNQTIDIVEPPKWLDTELLMMLVTVGAILAVAGYYAFTYVSGLAFIKKAKTRSKKVEPAARAAPNPSEWLKGTNYDRAPRARAGRGARGAAAPPAVLKELPPKKL